MLIALLLACNGSGPTTSVTEPVVECAIGSEACACTSGGACDGDLQCLEDVCVQPTCPVGANGCECTDGGTCDGALICLDTQLCGPQPVCGNSAVEQGETCDDGNTVTESCAYGETGCQVCDANCRMGPGAASYCGDGSLDAANGEECDEPLASSDCAYGVTACDVCDGDCTVQAGSTSFCGDGWVDWPNEDCDGEAYCTGCTFIGESYEPNDSISGAVQLQASSVDGTFSHALDMVHGPGLQSSPYPLFESPDLFSIDVCNGGQLTARIDFAQADGVLDLLIGRRPQEGSPSGPPPVRFEWVADSILDDFQTLTVDAPTPSEFTRTHYILVRGHEPSSTYILNTYTLRGTVTGCP